ncbi:glycoside hydrolase family 13 protein [Winogradskyella sp. SYSU M77433]|uniref:glycoside hydrolase family 13 protein n=1 Tax=Winogradskyella sp. SYSU M77433 TaxID=3042722 RepID=UPI002481624A|nr:glycoside hydrolase family 13 protein [Winogradskyella sp. SYSU M77433]MDH7914003.1 glycoside hydrolase family 13 protein [Winogradskyella sp. SYSU M77433]
MKYTYNQICILLSILFLSACNNPPESKVNKEFVPQWAKNVVWYQIFPERFRDGDSTNNPTINDLKGADPKELPKEWEVHPWGSDWYALQDYEKANGEPELWKHILRRRYGGDLQGVINKLDYLQDLGITAIYLNPVFQSPSLHKYDGESYHHIDPNFGPDPEGDRKLIASENPLDPSTWVWTSADKLALQLIDEAHSRDMKIIFDGVFNHLGYNSFAFQDVVKNQQNSPYKDWFMIKSWNDEEKGTEFDYEGWFGVKSLPEFKEDSTGIVEGPKKYIFNATQRWMNPQNKGIEHGIDGWRLDVAYCIGHPFWKKWRKHVRSINPEAYMTAEIVDDPEKVTPYMQGDEFDGEMNYNFAFASAEFFFNTDSTKINASTYAQKLKALRDLYPEGVAYVSQNLFGSHDSNRIGSHIVNRDRGIGNFRNWGTYFNASVAGNNPNYSTRKPQKEDIDLQKLFAIMQMTYVGAPMIYYGDEVGMWGGNDPDCRKPMIWDDIVYEDEVFNADGSTHKPDKVETNTSLFNHYKKLISIRNDHPSLQQGTYKTVFTNDAKGIFVFERQYEGESIVVAINNGGEEFILDIPELRTHCMVDLLSETVFDGDKIIVPNKWGMILKACQ